MAISLVFNESHCSFVRSLLSMPPTVVDSAGVGNVGYLRAPHLVENVNGQRYNSWHGRSKSGSSGHRNESNRKGPGTGIAIHPSART